jgi:hypothetical protein
MAIPQVTLQLRDRRIHEAAQRIAILYQQARLRAMGEGGAMLVRYAPGAATNGSFTVSQALAGLPAAGAPPGPAQCQFLPVPSCIQTDWNNAALAQFRNIETFDLIGVDATAFATLPVDFAGGPGSTTMDICFTPLGRTFARVGQGNPFVPLQNIPMFAVARRTSPTAPAQGRERTVLIPPTGIARLGL